MKRAEDSPEAGGPCYTLYLEYLGGLVPILKGRRISKLRPEFVIMDPKTDSKAGVFRPERVNRLLFLVETSDNCSPYGLWFIQTDHKLNSIHLHCTRVKSDVLEANILKP